MLTRQMLFSPQRLLLLPLQYAVAIEAPAVRCLWKAGAAEVVEVVRWCWCWCCDRCCCEDLRWVGEEVGEDATAADVDGNEETKATKEVEGQQQQQQRQLLLLWWWWWWSVVVDVAGGQLHRQ